MSALQHLFRADGAVGEYGAADDKTRCGGRDAAALKVVAEGLRGSGIHAGNAVGFLRGIGKGVAFRREFLALQAVDHLHLHDIVVEFVEREESAVVAVVVEEVPRIVVGDAD